MTNFEIFKNKSKEEKKEKLIEYFAKWAGIGDSYIYDLTRVKEAFAVGTMSFEDFEEWNYERVTMLVDEFIKWFESEAE